MQCLTEKQMRGHTLVWHNHEPQVLDEYIQDHYDGDLEYWSRKIILKSFLIKEKS